MINKKEHDIAALTETEKKEILRKLRKEIDGLDKKIVKLLSKRTLNSVLIGKIKKSLGLPVYDPEREKNIIRGVTEEVTGPLTDEALNRIYERIIDESRAAQKPGTGELNLRNILNSYNKVSFRNLLTKKQYLAVAGSFLVILALFWYTFFSPNYYSQKGPVKFEIRIGEPLSEIVNDLYKQGVIPSKTNMRVAAFLMGAEKKMRAARYKIPNGLSYLGLIDLFINGDADFTKEVFIREGLSIKWMAYTIGQKITTDSAAFVNLAEDPAFSDSVGINAGTMEGYLMPGKYYFYDNSTAQEIVDSLYNNFIEFWNDSLREQAQNLGYSIHQIVTLASIVKGETSRKEEMPIIAGVYYNRLKIGMPLQADPTVQYIQPNGWKRLSYKDLKMKSPYNTYIHTGLPPGPINNPGKDPILATLYPDSNNYLYFVADGKGGHNFSRNYSEHLRAVAKYRRWLRSRK